MIGQGACFFALYCPVPPDMHDAQRRNRLVGHLCRRRGEGGRARDWSVVSCIVRRAGHAMPILVPSCATVPKKNFLLRVLLREARQLLRRRLT